ncbi:unnamed protein product [Protopolystoma xenopodis]|uniref:Uncharacterized protein n=1 Tax=Protopolystoma xenopodis TaxID=117903 RepID=A0A3S5AJU5_9PLAT|nr:unnamed protein product [Protopolystoma xenopodis]
MAVPAIVRPLQVDSSPKISLENTIGTEVAFYPASYLIIFE